MCLIFAKPETNQEPLDLDHLRRAHWSNPHGFGYAYWDYDGGEWRTAKMKEASWAFVEKTLISLNEMSGHFAVHFRYRTRGDINKLNCHPFNLRRGEWLMHNGTVNITTPDGYSDSRYVAKLLRESGQAAHALLEMATTKNRNRFLIGQSDGEYRLFGEWHQAKDGMYSKARWSKPAAMPPKPRRKQQPLSRDESWQQAVQKDMENNLISADFLTRYAARRYGKGYRRNGG
jgi:predicted glutamine amidotransferase